MEKRCSKCDTVKSFDSFHKHKGKPYGLARWCKECACKNAKVCYDKRSPEERLKVKRAWQDSNREYVNHYNNEWRKRNPEKHAARQAKRRAYKLQAAPSWLNGTQKAHILRTYKLAKLMTEATGQDYHVDHIVPLKGKNVCGLHVPWNLQVLRADLNLKKSNFTEGS